MPVPPIQFEQQDEKLTKMNGVIAGCVAAAVVGVIFIVIIIIIIVCCHRRKNGYRDISSDEGKIKSSSSLPNLTVESAATLSNLLRSKSAGQSPPNPSKSSSGIFPQPDIDSSNGKNGSDSGSSLSPTDQYSPFQRSFHVDNFPYLEFTTQRNENALTVVILSLCCIPDNVRGSSENSEGGFFVKAILLPDEICLQTKVYKPTGALNQECNECLEFENIHENTGLLMSAYFIDQRHVRMSLGHTTVPTAGATDKDETVHRTRLEQLSQALHSNIGELELTLTFLSDKSRLKVDVQSFKELTLMDVHPKSVLMIRIQFLHGRKVSKEKEIKLSKLERNPRVNEGFVFSLTTKRADISHLTILLTEVMARSDQAEDTTEHCIGRIDIGPYLYARGEGLLHWQTILNKPNTPVFMSHSLVPPLFG